MPALVTHYLFGEEVLPLVDTAHGDSEDARNAFLLGCQGPDPLLFAVTTTRGAIVRSMGSALHKRLVSASFDRLRPDVEKLPERIRPIGKSFVAGLFAHYILDRTAHPYVYAQEFALCDYNAELADAYHEVHALIESEIDSGMLDHLRGLTTLQLTPECTLEASAEVTLAAGTLLAQTAIAVHGIELRPADYPGAVDDMRMCYRSIEPYESLRTQRVGMLERFARPHSMLAALSHKSDVRADNPSMNMAGVEWSDPFKTARSCESFPEVFARAVADYREAYPLFEAGVPAQDLVHGLDYQGKPMDAAEQPLGSIHPI